MRGVIRKILLAGIVVAGSSAHASGGVIAFSGAVVEPTCSVGTQRIAAAEAVGTSQRYHCSEQVSAASAQVAQSYALSVTELTGTPLGSDRLIVYFANYLSAQPKLVTQVYD
jgi:nicotinamide mononucleotide (NMN) deamidase PncC